MVDFVSSFCMGDLFFFRSQSDHSAVDDSSSSSLFFFFFEITVDDSLMGFLGVECKDGQDLHHVC